MEQATPGFEPAADAVELRPSTIAEIRKHGRALVQAHSDEAEPDLAAGLDLNWEGYESADAGGMLIVLVAWEGRSMVGYAVAAVFESLHYAGMLFCQHDALYVIPRLRGRRVGARLLEALRTEARDRGCRRLLMHAKPQSKLESLLRLRGFREEETIFVEDLCHKP